MQLINRHCTGELLDFSSLEDIKSGCISLRNALGHITEPNTIASADYAMDFLRQYNEDLSITYLSQHKLRDSTLVQLTALLCALFTEQTSNMDRMPDSPSKWIKLTLTPCITDRSQDHILLEQANNVALNANVAILAGHPYWFFSKLRSEPEQLHSAILDLTTSL